MKRLASGWNNGASDRPDTHMTCWPSSKLYVQIADSRLQACVDGVGDRGSTRCRCDLFLRSGHCTTHLPRSMRPLPTLVDSTLHWGGGGEQYESPLTHLNVRGFVGGQGQRERLFELGSESPQQALPAELPPQR